MGNRMLFIEPRRLRCCEWHCKVISAITNSCDRQYLENSKTHIRLEHYNGMTWSYICPTMSTVFLQSKHSTPRS